jgi:hypothetical protein
VLADDLVGRVTLDPLRARVPRHHVPGGIEQEDRVFADALDEATEYRVVLSFGARSR